MYDSLHLYGGERLLAVKWIYGLPGHRDSGLGVWYFAVDETVPKGEEAAKLRAAVANYFRSSPADWTDGFNPNWGDAINHVDFTGTGFRFLSITPPAAEILVDHDEEVYDYMAEADHEDLRRNNALDLNG